jgi:fructuronate reductase
VQIAMDGSQKMPPRIVSTLAVRLESGESIERLAFATAAWFRFLRGRADDGSHLKIDDPLAERLTKAASGADSPERLSIRSSP